MREHNVPGLSVAVVDDRGLVWSEGFGVTDIHGSEPVTSDTVFSIQSTSKVFTATAVLLRCRTACSTWTSRSPRTCPVHRAQHLRGAPRGEDHFAPPAQPHCRLHARGASGQQLGRGRRVLRQHLRSFSTPGCGSRRHELRLLEPGIDLAGYVLQQVTGRTFVDYVQDHLFEPLAMTNSSFDAVAIRANDKRAIGDAPPAPWIVRSLPGGRRRDVQRANDLARFVQFQLGHGVVDGRAVLDPALLDEMLTVQFPERGERYGYGLGVGPHGLVPRAQRRSVLAHRRRSASAATSGGCRSCARIVVLTNSDQSCSPPARSWTTGAHGRPVSRPIG